MRTTLFYSIKEELKKGNIKYTCSFQQDKKKKCPDQRIRTMELLSEIDNVLSNELSCTNPGTGYTNSPIIINNVSGYILLRQGYLGYLHRRSIGNFNKKFLVRILVWTFFFHPVEKLHNCGCDDYGCDSFVNLNNCVRINQV